MIGDSFRFVTRATLGYAGAVVVVIAAALAFRWPLLRTGFYMDDYIQLEMLEGRYPLPRQALDLFCWTRGTNENAILREAGFLPWWSHPDVKLTMFRPVSSALIWFDHAVFGHNALAYHLHSLAWWVAFLALFSVILQEVLPRPAALLALVLVVAHPAHTILLGWLASRNAVVAATLVMLGFWAHLHVRKARSSRARVAARCVAFGSYVTAMFASEYALALLPYPAVYSCLQERNDVRRVLRLIASWGVLAISYAALRAGLGYGASGSGMYLDPIAEPLAYVRAALLRLPTIAADVVFALRSGWLHGFPWPDALRALGIDPEHWAPFHIALGVASLGIGVYVAAQLLHRRALIGSGRIRFVIVALPLTFVPILATLPDNRIMLPPLLGWSMLLGQWLWSAYDQLRMRHHTTKNWLSCIAALLLWMLGSVSPPVNSANEIRDLPHLAGVVRAGILDPRLDSILQSGPVLLVAAAEPTTFLLPMVRSWYHRAVPSSFQVLGQPLVSQRLERLSENSFALEDSEVVRLPIRIPDAFNREGAYVGQTAHVNDLHVTVERVFQGRSVRARFESDRPLSDYVLLTQTSGGLEPIVFPALGDTFILAPPVHSHDLEPQP